MQPLSLTAAKPQRGSGLVPLMTRLAGLWLRRSRTRPRLWTLSDHELRDLGLERCAADRESLKPFWRG
ncbi:DUF1127 domain-containing protein [Inquilinus limosus]|uniref:YjiS-like domain-containing protein n=1 Tax=Inquilinus limosus TaxID=171674 RepID=A0A211ZJJ6_9PROT|nr:DUF1127 domain-containing protein [Inquilinus limosus]OWJ65354.1 hypothetical protein BWR60_19675 [Inquilinus limosus]